MNRTISELRAHAKACKAKLAKNPEDAARLTRELSETERLIKIFNGRSSGVAGDDPGIPRQTRVDEPDPNSRAGLRGAALATIERSAAMPDAARERLTQAIETDLDPEARLARFVAETGSDAYYRAFAKWFGNPQTGHYEWTPEERDAQIQVKALERSLSLGGTGGLLVPVQLDPQILISSAGSVDPMREVSRVETTVQNTAQFVTSAGVTASWDAESAEVSDDTPTLVQPEIPAHKGAAFVPVTYELLADSNIAQQVGVLFADSKAQLEASAFTTGSGTGQPQGVITGVSAVAGSVVLSGVNVLGADDPFDVQNALPARWRSSARFMANLSIMNGYRVIAKSANVQESLVDDSTSPPRMAGWSLHENSNMDGALNAVAADFVLLAGDFRQYIITDRLGTSIVPIPALFGAANRPSGEAGFYMYWRTGGEVVIADAFRLLNHDG